MECDQWLTPLVWNGRPLNNWYLFYDPLLRPYIGYKMRTGNSVLHFVTTVLVFVATASTVTYTYALARTVLKGSIMLLQSSEVQIRFSSNAIHLKVRIFSPLIHKRYANKCAVIFRGNPLWLLIHLSRASGHRVFRCAPTRMCPGPSNFSRFTNWRSCNEFLCLLPYDIWILANYGNVYI